MRSDMAIVTSSCCYFIAVVITIFCCFCSVETRSITGKFEAINSTMNTSRARSQGMNVADLVADLIEQIELTRREFLSTNWNESATGESELSEVENHAPNRRNDSMIANELNNWLTHSGGRALSKLIKCLNESEKKANSSMGRREEPPKWEESSPSIGTSRSKDQIDQERRITKVFLSLNGL